MNALKHKNCGKEVSIAVLNGDCAYYVWCDHCRDLVEEGELVMGGDRAEPNPVESNVRLRVDHDRIRPFNE